MLKLKEKVEKGKPAKLIQKQYPERQGKNQRVWCYESQEGLTEIFTSVEMTL